VNLLTNEFSARYFDGKTSSSRQVTVKLTVPGYILIQELGAQSRYRLTDIHVADRLGNQPARIDLPDDGRLEIASAEDFFAAYRASSGRRQWLHGLESNWGWVLVALIITLSSGWAAYQYGVPAAARAIAFAMPRDVDATIGAESLTLLDQHVLEPSSLEAERRNQLRVRFDEVVNLVGSGGDYRLVFRSGGDIGANALALPSGVIVLTDELVELAEHDNGLAAILAHEVGHVRNRHSLRMLLQQSLLSGLVLVITGDVSSVSGIVASVPSLLVYTSYSREFEYDADQVAREYLLAADMPLYHFADILRRLDSQDGETRETTGWLSTHPATEERVRQFDRPTS